MKWAGGRFKNPQEKLFTRNPRSWAVGHLGTQHCRYCKLICIQEKTGRGQKRDTWKQQPKTYSDCPQAADLPGWSIYTQGCITTHLPCSLLGHVFWPINKLNYHTHADPGWWGLDFSNLTNVVLDEADLEKDKTNCSLLLLGLIDALTLATLASWSFKAACSVQPRHQKKVRPFHLHGWFSSKRERAQGTEIKLAPGQPSNFCRVWSLLKVANVWSSQGCRCFAGQMLGEMNLQSNPAQLLMPFTYKHSFHKQKSTFALSCHARYLLSASMALYEQLNLPDSLRNAPEPAATSHSETSSLHHHHHAWTSPAIAWHICRLTTSTYKYATSALLLPGGAQPGSSCTITSSSCRTVTLRLFVLTGWLPKLAISNAPCSIIKDDK